IEKCAVSAVSAVNRPFLRFLRFLRIPYSSPYRFWPPPPIGGGLIIHKLQFLQKSQSTLPIFGRLMAAKEAMDLPVRHAGVASLPQRFKDPVGVRVSEFRPEDQLSRCFAVLPDGESRCQMLDGNCRRTLEQRIKDTQA